MPENNEEQVTKVVTNLNAGVAKPIPINANDAVAIAREQAAYQQTVDALNNNQNPNQATMNQGINNGGNVVAPTPVGQQNQQIDLNQLNQVNDLVKVVDVKYSKKTIFILLGIIAVIVIIIILELPMLMGE